MSEKFKILLFLSRGKNHYFKASTKHLDRANQNVHISCTMYKYCWQVLDNSCMLYELVNNQVHTMYICTCFEITFFFSCKLKYLLTYLHSLQDKYVDTYMYVQCSLHIIKIEKGFEKKTIFVFILTSVDNSLIFVEPLSQC